MSSIFIECKPKTFGDGHKKADSKYNEFKNAIKGGMKKLVKGKFFDISKKLTVNFEIHIFQDRRRTKKRNDLDNFAKPVIDALHNGNIIASEWQVFEINMRMVEVKSDSKEGIQINIKAFEA